MTETLSRILFPLGVKSFLRHYETRTHVHVRRALPDYYSHLLTSQDLDAVLRDETLPAAFVHVVREGGESPLEEWSRIGATPAGSVRQAVPEKLFQFHAEGATLILNQAERFVPSLSSATEALTRELGFPAQANVYLTPPHAAGFRKHRDDHEVLAVQIQGRKRWVLYPEDAPEVEIDLQSGDLLYLPRGLAHAASAQDEASIHVTLGLRPAYAVELVEELARLAGEDKELRFPAPPFFAGEAARRNFDEAFLQQLQALIAKTGPAELVELRLRALTEKHGQGWAGRQADLSLLHRMTPATVLRKRNGIAATVKRADGYLVVEFAGKSVTVPGFLNAALNTILSETAFAVGEIEGFISEPGRMKLAGEFIKAGLLRIVAI